MKPNLTFPRIQRSHSSRYIRSVIGPAACALALLAHLPAIAASPDAFSFTHIGILAGERTSEVTALNNDMTLAGCTSVHTEQDVHPYTRYNSARWTPAEGLKALPPLPYTESAASGDRSGYVAGNDVTADGTKLLFTSHTTPTDGRAAATCAADGSNVVVLSSLPGGDKMQAATQISDDGKTIFGYATTGFYDRHASRWTEATGFELLTMPAGYAESGPVKGAISANGSVSAGSMATYDQDGNATAEQAYRWAPNSGAQGIGYLPTYDRSDVWALSSDGQTILGTSWNSNNPRNPDFFIWKAATGMTKLRGPAENYNPTYFTWGAGISGDGSVIAASWYRLYSDGCGNYGCDYTREYVSYILNPNKGYYVDIIDAIKQAGGGSSIEGWTNFTINGVTDDGNTVYGHARNTDGHDEGFIAHFPAGYLASVEPPARLLNISTRLRVGSGEKVSIAGFIVTGTVPKQVIVRAIGASLQSHGVVDALADPVLELHEPDGTVRTNDEWKSTQQAAIEATGVAPTDDHESAIIATLAPGKYTAVLSGKGGSSGIGLVEAYDLNSSINARVANISTRGFVDTGDNAMIGGMYIGIGRTNVLIRAIGPSLEASGVTGALKNPTLEVRDGNGVLIDSNDNWKERQEASIEATGVPPTDDRESALITRLMGRYTAIVRGADGGTGVALVEVYDLGP
jgi:uncharacterized membrane protein